MIHYSRFQSVDNALTEQEQAISTLGLIVEAMEGEDLSSVDGRIQQYISALTLCFRTFSDTMGTISQEIENMMKEVQS